MGGVGYSWATLDYPGDELSDNDASNDDTNVNVGLIYKAFKRIGFTIEYDSVPEAISFGFVYYW